MTKAAQRFYRNDDIFRNFVRHCAKPTLVTVMVVEKKGTIFDTCVKELYREVDFEAVKNMRRDTVSHYQVTNATPLLM
jgi:hypothetical protein